MAAKRALPDEVARLRARMDRVNARLVRALQERARLALRIGRAKARHGLAAPDPARERAMLRAMLTGAGEGYSLPDLRAILRQALAASRRLVVADRRGRKPESRGE